MVRRGRLRWLGVSLLLAVSIHVIACLHQTTDMDDPVRSRLSRPVSMIRSEFITPELERPLEDCAECRVRDPMADMKGSGCRWSSIYPHLSCRIFGLPLTLIGDTRLGGGEEFPVTLLARAMGPLEATRLAKAASKVVWVVLLWWLIGYFGLPEALLPFLCISPLLQGIASNGVHYSIVYTLVYAGFCGVLLRGNAAFAAGAVSLMLASYAWLSAVFAAVPAVIVLLARRMPRRALALGAVAVALIATRLAVNATFPLLAISMQHDLVDHPIWRKSGASVLAFIADMGRIFSLSSAWADDVPPNLRRGPFPELGRFVAVLNLATLALFCWSALLPGESGSRKARSLAGLFLVSAVPFFLFGHDNMPTYYERYQHLFPIAAAAVYLGAGALGSFLSKRGFRRAARLPIAWVWGVALLTSLDWIATYRSSGPMMTANADFIASLSARLIEKNVREPLMITEVGGIGTFDLFSGGAVRPLYVSDSPPDPRPGHSPVETLLSRWESLGSGTLVQRTIDYDWLETPIRGSDLKEFARKRGIQIISSEFFPYRDSATDGFWIVDFINSRWRKGR